MRLLFDQNLSFRLCSVLADAFPDSTQVHLLGLEGIDDRTLWNLARTENYTLVSQDSDFADLAALFGPPPKVIWLRLGNQPTRVIANRLLASREILERFASDAMTACLEIY
ncbi:MAG TPA: DUF5615 family PIN-like protein [Bauldia sp.]|nr:DUF5615 family PIN-like protein [Bauldia sp.]